MRFCAICFLAFYQYKFLQNLSQLLDFKHKKEQFGCAKLPFYCCYITFYSRTALILLTPADELCSFAMRNFPRSFVFSA